MRTLSEPNRIKVIRLLWRTGGPDGEINSARPETPVLPLPLGEGRGGGDVKSAGVLLPKAKIKTWIQQAASQK